MKQLGAGGDMAGAVDVFTTMKEFVGFSDLDAANLREIGPLFERHGGSLTDGFYETLARYPATASLLEGRVDALKTTHRRWMSELFQGEYGQAYYESRMRIGMVHVKVGIDPYFVEGVMDVIRTGGLAIVFAEVADRGRAVACARSLLRLLDLDLLIINLAYGEERLNRLTAFTGFGRRLIENCIRKGGK
jgi:hypothetical protein